MTIMNNVSTTVTQTQSCQAEPVEAVRSPQLKARSFWLLLFCVFMLKASAQQTVPDSVMQRIYQEVKTPYKYGLVVVPDSDNRKIDCPTIFRKGRLWYMTYLVFDGRGYETWLSQSNDLRS